MLPMSTWPVLAIPARKGELPRGLDAAWHAAGGLLRRLTVRTGSFLAQARRVLAREKKLASLSDARLKELAEALRERFRRGRDRPADLETAFALVREVAARKLGERPFLVQVAGALALDAGCVIEMATGEGKTLTATMPATVAGWRGRGCHIITANDYLARRDAEWMAPVYRFCGLRVAHVDQAMAPGDRREAYAADITYTTNKEVAADFLRDRLVLGRVRTLPEALLTDLAGAGGPGRLVQRGLHAAIIDEADSLLIDEAVTPLIISGLVPNSEQVAAFCQAADVSRSLRAGQDYRADARYREIDLTGAGKRRIADLAEPLGGLWSGARRREELVTQALLAEQFYHRDRQYVVQDGKVVIVDEFTGRLMPDREWRDGLHQAVQAKEELEVLPPKETLARISFQRFFRLYRKLSGMTGTAREGRGEFWRIYRMPAAVVPTNRPCIRRRLADRVFATEQAKWRAVVDEIVRLRQTGRPVLVGTRSVASSERLSGLLSEAGIEHEVLNAVRHAEEARIVAQAGQPGRVTVATNMAGRGTDIKLGRGVAEAGGLHVVATERHEAGRIDRQLFGRCARQGDPGSAQAIVSLEDELVRRHAPHVCTLLRGRFGSTDREISSPMTRRVFDAAQKRAERLSARQRAQVLRTDDWLDEYLGFAGREH